MTITHPNDLFYQTNIPTTVSNAIDNHKEGRILGRMDIGVFRGDERLKNLSQIYGAVKYARKGWEGEKKPSRIIKEAIKKLKQHDVKNIDQTMVMKMNTLFDNYDLGPP